MRIAQQLALVDGPSPLLALAERRIRVVCLDPIFAEDEDWRSLRPERLFTYITQEMEPRRDLGSCML